MLSLTTAYFGFLPIMLIALIPYGLFLVNARSYRRVFFATLLMSVPFCFFSGEPFFRLAGSWWTGTPHGLLNESLLYPLGITAIIIISSLLYLVPAFVYMKVRAKFPVPIFLFAFTWVCIEFFRSWFLLAGYSWGVVGYALIDSLYLKHVAAVFGVYGLSFLSVIFGVWSASIISGVIETKGGLMTRLRYAFFAPKHVRDSFIVAICFTSVIVFGLYRELRGPLPVEPLRVAVIASNIPTEESIGEGSYYIYRQLLVKAFRAKPDIIVLPENVFPYFVVNEETGELILRPEVYLPNAHELYTDLLFLSRTSPKTMLALPLHSDKYGLRYNSILFYRNGAIVNVYHKRRPVPFTEFSPFGLHLPLYETITKGDARQDFRMGNITLSGYLCSEVGITDLSSRDAGIIIVPSNDSVLLSDGIGLLQHQYARMRALEAGAYMLRSSKGGISSIIDPYGRILATKEGVNDVMILDIK